MELNRVQIFRGRKKNLPELADGQLAFCQDTLELYIGTPWGNCRLAQGEEPKLLSESDA